MKPQTEPTAVELLIPAHARRITIAEHHAFRDHLAGYREALDDLDDLAPWHNPAQRRKESEINRLDSLLDELAAANGRKDAAK